MATLKSAVCNPTKRSKVISALGATKKSQKEWDTMFVCRLKHQIYDVTGITPAGTAALNYSTSLRTHDPSNSSG